MEERVPGDGLTEEAPASKRPFGSPDGDRSPLADPLRHFIDFRGSGFPNGLGMDPDDRTVRVIVGGKGAGKTLYLRRLQDAASRENSIYAGDWQISLPSSTDIIRIADWEKINATTTIERWQDIWKRAIYRSVISHILYSDDPLLDDVRGVHGETLRLRCGDLLADHEESESIYDALGDIVTSHDTKKGLRAYLSDRRWVGVEKVLADALQTCPPICFYLDALDHRFHHAPRPWMLCQLGLFDAVMNFLSHPNFGARLHIVIGLRDVVFSAIQDTEHATKYTGNDYIRLLDWNRGAIEYFLQHKLDSLPSRYLMGGSNARFVERWLGMSEIENEVRKKNEKIEKYLLRHTRLIPRDIVVLGNTLCDIIDRARAYGQTFLMENDIREAVKMAAQSFGSEQLNIVANHLTAIAMPRGAAHYDFDSIYTSEGLDGIEGGQAYQESVASKLGTLIGTLRTDRFSKHRLDDFADKCRAEFNWVEDVPSILWQNGLLGYIDGKVMTGSTVFFATTHKDSLRLPGNKPGYALHPILIDTIDSLGGVGAPVEAY
jgi:hypothetical protein